ncbi:alpha-amylase [Bdellovibrio bacteriovorus]|uniref:Maltokinase n=1 Tax=Bdellovibrio bacteriovorus TaxID=959 RepID=A0A150WJ55_BDEBC|nr:maltose alpha-D-glucosyltransferase [Bdellovibrio bacteriovorus]KYG63798.1 alpha-amylase [Bdellovibrio bacteriovorus]
MITRQVNEQNPLWYKDAIIYQLHVRAFFDSNDDGIGDFQGLIQKLDYLANLGVTAIWLLPFYPSPLKDDGYDIADYTKVNPAYGNLEDFKEFLHQAHRRNMRVITELVINHTSDQHEWFQKSRRAPPDSYWRNFYVWSDDPKKYKGVRIIFKDFETSNWAWDPVAKSYYWHRFYSHQPDLNFDNPEVQKAVFQAFDFWMEMGVDGMRLDAVPYLFEREGTSCENLPETHDFLKKLRAYIDSKYPGTMLLAEANQWPEDAVNYFGNGDECHMNFHFPLMPRLFMALKMEDRYSIIDILKQTPEIPENCQWATFLRNHDELTLEMVTDEERDYMYKVYASDPRARINLGVRRRLAPLAGNDRRQIELLNSLLFSLPGSPIIYYGDEIGMGDNIYLGDRDGVRTPFQWNLDRNAGFSKTNPQRLYLPVISTPEYHAESINVENLRANPTSLLWWMTKLIALRTSNPVLSRGKINFINNSNPKVLSYVRKLEGEGIVCVVNLSRNAQFVELNLSEFKGATPTEIFGQTEFPKIGEGAYVLTLAPYSFYWLQVSQQEAAEKAGWSTKETPIIFDEDPLQTLRDRKVWAPLSKSIKHYLMRSRWYSGKNRRISTIELVESFPIPMPDEVGPARLAIVRVHFSEGLAESYLLGLGHAKGARAKKMRDEKPQVVIGETSNGHDGVVYDALMDADFCKSLLKAMLTKQNIAGSFGKIISEFYDMEDDQEIPEPQFKGFDQSNSSVLFGDKYYMKFYRRIEEGENPEVELGRYLGEKNFKSTSKYLGNLSYLHGTQASSLAVVQKVVKHEIDGWNLIVNRVEQLGERLITESMLEKSSLKPRLKVELLPEMNPSVGYQEVAGYSLMLAKLLGERTADMHLALGSDDRDPVFIPEPFTPFHQRSVFQSFRNLTDKVLNLLENALPQLEGQTLELAKKVLAAQNLIYDRFAYMKHVPLSGLRTRIHGDYHLGQVLYTGEDFLIIDFEGEPARGFGERKLKRSPLKDVAGMIRSFAYVAEFSNRKYVIKEQDRASLMDHLHTWTTWMSVEFLKSYLNKMAGSELLPKEDRQIESLLKMFLLEKALYEVGYEIQNRPDWVNIPLTGVLEILEDGDGSEKR